jgi:hypothetical protein
MPIFLKNFIFLKLLALLRRYTIWGLVLGNESQSKKFQKSDAAIKLLPLFSVI